MQMTEADLFRMAVAAIACGSTVALLGAIEINKVSDRRSNAVLALIFQREFFAFYDM